MIECDSTPIDLAFDELLRVLTRMESAPHGYTFMVDDISELIDEVIEAMGVKRGFAKSIEHVLEQTDVSHSSLMRVALLEAVALGEASWYVSRGLSDAPSNGDVLRARTLISNTLFGLDAHEGCTQLDLGFSMAA